MSDKARALIAGLSLISVAVIWKAAIANETTSYGSLLPSLVLGGIGCGLFWAPSASIVLGAVSEEEQGLASGANNAIREVGGVFGVAVLTSIFSAHGGFGTPESLVQGMTPAFFIGGVIVGLAAVAAFALPRRSRVEALQPALAAGA